MFRELVVAHTPDPDDAYMFYGLVSGHVKVGDYSIQHVLLDIETINRGVVEEGRRFDVCALSAHAFAYVSNNYYLMIAGASMGEGYGPILVAKRKIDNLRGKKIAVPGKYTTARLLLKLAIGEFEEVHVRFDQVPALVKRGDVDAGLLIHEEQIAYEERGLVKVFDLWEWWESVGNGLPMPLGVNVVGKWLGMDLAAKIRRALQESIKFAWEHHDEALKYAIRFSRVRDRKLVDRFVRMYVNKRTYDMGEDGRKALELLYRLAFEKKLIPKPVTIEYV